MSLTLSETETLFGEMLDGHMPEADIRNLLIELADRGETAQEIAGAAKAMRARMISVKAPDNAIDVCGTGGDGSHSLNVSTAVAIIVAACEVPVAKHGNRAASSKAGAADTLEVLGLNLDRAMETAEETLADLGICFLFAQKHHPALGPIAPIRKAIGKRTIFNYLGPLCNPGGVKRQLIGVPTPAIIPVYAEAIRLLNGERISVVSGMEGLDEISISGPSATQSIGFSAIYGVTSDVITPENAGLPIHTQQALKGGDAEYNATALRRLLDGEHSAYRDAVLINAAAALIVADEVDNLYDGVEEAAEAIDKGLAKALLDCWIHY